jgi:5-methylcytosine-specific restriction endonuclease McrA
LAYGAQAEVKLLATLCEEKIVAVEDAKRAHADRMIAESIRNRQTREQGYREQALKIYPWICGRCSREFTRESLQQLTVHHKDHNHDNNPTDGSNWELLCLYCHDNEHSRELDADAARQAGVGGNGQANASPATAQPFANLKELLKRSER